MIRGVYHPPQPYVSGFVYFPAPVDEVIEVPFLVDTGASWTMLSSLDLVKLGTKLLKVPISQSPISLTGIGGTVQAWTTRCGLVFFHEDGSRTGFALNVALNLALTDLPSLLGMDVLAHGVLSVDAVNTAVTWEVPNRVFTL